MIIGSRVNISHNSQGLKENKSSESKNNRSGHVKPSKNDNFKPVKFGASKVNAYKTLRGPVQTDSVSDIQGAEKLSIPKPLARYVAVTIVKHELDCIDQIQCDILKPESLYAEAGFTQKESVGWNNYVDKQVEDILCTLNNVLQNPKFDECFQLNDSVLKKDLIGDLEKLEKALSELSHVSRELSSAGGVSLFRLVLGKVSSFLGEGKNSNPIHSLNESLRKYFPSTEDGKKGGSKGGKKGGKKGGRKGEYHISQKGLDSVFGAIHRKMDMFTYVKKMVKYIAAQEEKFGAVSHSLENIKSVIKDSSEVFGQDDGGYSILRDAFDMKVSGSAQSAQYQKLNSSPLARSLGFMIKGSDQKDLSTMCNKLGSTLSLK